MNSTIKGKHYKKAKGEFLSSTKMKGSGAGRGIRRHIFGHKVILNVPGQRGGNITTYAAIPQNGVLHGGMPKWLITTPTAYSLF